MVVGLCRRYSRIGRMPAVRIMSVTKLLHTRMRVNDIERTVEILRAGAGAQAARRHTSPRGAQLAFLATPNSEEEIELCQMPAGKSPSR